MLRTAIRAGDIQPGDRIRESDIAERSGVSRTPVREALRRLETEGLLASSRRGLSVTSLDLGAVVELYAIRETLEGLAARFAAQHASDTEISSLRALLTQQSGLRDPRQLAELNRQFHHTIHVAARNRYLMGVLISLQDGLALLPGTTYSMPERPAAALREHNLMLKAIEKRDVVRAEEATRAHIRAGFALRQSMIVGGPVGTQGR